MTYSRELFERQTEEDAMHAGSNFAEDFPTRKEMPAEDPDGEDHLAIPLARAAAPGKPSTPEAIHIASDDDDDVDCEILDVIDALPLNCAPPVVPRSAAVTKARREPQTCGLRHHPCLWIWWRHQEEQAEQAGGR